LVNFFYWFAVQDANTLKGCTVSFEYHSAAHNRPMFVAHPAALGDVATSTTTSSDSLSAAAAAAAGPSTPTNKNNKSNSLLQQMLQKTLSIDATTAGYYLSAAGGDARAAIAACKEDQRWDAKMRSLKRSLGSTKHVKRK
jgi:outer membrane scaffolding protein for murein synthesis (MipA/OmpV family)